MEEKLQNIFALLKANNFHYLDTWVRECVEHYFSNDPGISNNKLWDQVKEQWLLSDLRESAVPAFPPNLKDQSKTTLTGKYVVQVETMVDSGCSRYSQFQDLQKDKRENIRATRLGEDEPAEKRCLTMQLNDGVQLLSGMEYEVIPELKLNHPDLLPGFKMLITGPVICRKGMLMLSQRHVRVLGGEVNSLVETNSYRALLMGALGITNRPLVSNPPQPSLDSGQPPSRVLSPPSQQPTASCYPSSRNRQSADSGYPQTRSLQPTVDELMDDDDEFLMTVPLNDDQVPPRSQQMITTTVRSSELDGFDDMFNDDFDLSEIPDAPAGSSSLKRPPSASSLNDGTSEVGGSGQSDFKRPCNNLDDDIDVNPFRDIDWDHNPFRDDEDDDNPFRDPKPSTSKSSQVATNSKATQPRTRKNNSSSKASNRNQGMSQNTSAVPSSQTKKEPKKRLEHTETQPKLESTQFKVPLSTKPSTSSLSKTKQSPISNFLVPSSQEPMEVVSEPRFVSAEPFVYLHQICTKELKYDALYKIKATILTLKTKISVDGDNFSLLAKICDGSYSIDVNLSSDILEHMLGFSPSEMIAMLKEKKRNSALAERLTSGFKQTQRKLISLDCIFCIQFFKDNSVPRVIALEDVTTEHLAILRRRQI